MKLNRLVIDAWGALQKLLGNLDPVESNRDKLTILMFHRCLPHQYREAYPYKGLVVTPEDLDWIIGLLKRTFNIYPVSEALKIFNNETNSPKPLMSLTFDDGQWDNLKYAHPILQKHAVNATFYIPTQAVNDQRLIWHDLVSLTSQYFSSHSTAPKAMEWKRQLPTHAVKHLDDPVQLVEALKISTASQRADLCDWIVKNVGDNYWPKWSRMMSWDEVRQLSNYGHEIGSHCVSHNILTQLSGSEIKSEIQSSKMTIEEECGIRVTSVCYPNGDYDERCIKAACDFGYENGVTTKWGLSDLTTNRYSLKRIDINPDQHLSFWGKRSVTRTLLRITNQFPSII